MASQAKSNISLEVRGDGVYLTVDATKEGKPSRMQLLKVIEEFGVQDIDFNAVNEVFKTSESIVTKKISANTHIDALPETITITVEKGALEAYIQFSPPSSGGKKATLDDIRIAAESAGIRYGIIPDTLETLAEAHAYGERYLIAKGLEPVEGKDGYVTVHYDMRTGKGKPRELEGGKVDYRHLDLIKVVYAGNQLATITPAEPGVDGMDIYNRPIPAKKVKPAPSLPRGKNTSFSEDGLHLISDINGQITSDGNRISVSPVLDINGDVDNSTGDISFNGAVFIHGNVVSGFSVEADGNIEIHGVVEAAVITSKENISVGGGVQGQDKAVITAGGNITTKFAESCTLAAGGDIYADSIMHSIVKCNGSLELNGKRSLLVGGKTIAGKAVRAKVIGSTMATLTEIEVGSSPEIVLEYKTVVNEYNLVKAEYDKISALVDGLNAMNAANALNEDRKKILLKSVHTKMFLRDKLVACQEKLNRIAALMVHSDGVVEASEVIRGGVKVTISNALLFVNDDIAYCRLRNVDSKIEIGTFG